MPRKNPIPLSFLTYSPWGASRVFLKGRRLEDNEKEWLANVVCSGLVSINDIAHFYSIPARTLRSWTSAKDKNLPLPGKRGRAMRLPDDGTMVYTEELKSASKHRFVKINKISLDKDDENEKKIKNKTKI